MRDALIQQGTTGHIIGAFFDVYFGLGFGFLEHVYSLALERELVERGRLVGREVSIPIFYKGAALTSQRVDMIVDERVVVEIKSTYALHPTAKRQTSRDPDEVSETWNPAKLVTRGPAQNLRNYADTGVLDRGPGTSRLGRGAR